MQRDGYRLIYHRTRGKYYVQRPDGKRRSLHTDELKTAKSRFTDYVNAQQRPNETCADIFAAYLEDKKGKASHERMEYAWKRLAPVFGHIRPDQISRQLCRDYASQRDAAGATIRKELETLRAAIKHAGIRGCIFEFPPSSPPRDRYLTRAEYRRLFFASPTFHVKLFIALGIATAGRQTAILELTWDQVDFDRQRIDLGKGGKGRAIVPMTKRARRMLCIARKGAVTDYVIEWAGKPLGSIKKGFGFACRQAGLKDVTPHTLRHTAAVWMAEAGVTMPEIAAYLGHSDSRITERVYAKFSPEYLSKAARALD